MIPLFKENDMKMFYKYLKNSTCYFEYGSGGSTYQASICPNIKKIYSVESDLKWHNKLKATIKSTNVQYMFNEMNTQPNSFGHPGPNSTALQKINYSSQINKLSDEEIKNIDMVLIDGRFRVACCLKLFNHISNDCFVVFDDFINRPQYHIVLNAFNVIEKTKDNQMVVLKKKPNVTFIPDEIIKKYEMITD
jgi:hypothetical protein